MSSTPTPPLGPDLDLGSGRRVPLALAAMLGLGLLVQLALPPSPPPAVSMRASRSGLDGPALRPAEPVAPVADAAILAKPLFSVDRSPVSAPSVAPAGAFTLLGVARSRGQAVATVQDGAGAAHTLSLGEEIEGWRLLGVGPAGASFGREGVVQSLRVGMGSARPAAPADGALSVVPSPAIPPAAGVVDRR